MVIKVHPFIIILEKTLNDWNKWNFTENRFMESY